MSTIDNSKDDQLADILNRLQSMERRIRVIESEIGISLPFVEEGDEKISASVHGGKTAAAKSTGQGFESGFGEYGLAGIGNIVLLLGIAFLMQYIQNKGFVIISAMFGYAVVGGIFLLSQYLKKTFSFLAQTFIFTSYVLMYYVTMRLHFFTEEPLISNKTIALILLLAVVVFQLIYAVRRNSRVLAGVTFVMLACLALLSDSTQPLLVLITSIAIISVVFYFRFGWWKLTLFSICLVYSVLFVWFAGNPLMGNPVGFITAHEYGYLYLFGIAAIYSLIAIDNSKIQSGGEVIAISGVMINGLFFTLSLVLFVVSFFKEEYILLFFLLSVCCLAFSVALKSRSSWKFAPAFYALYGFLALSIAVYGIYGFPRVYWLLSLQSLLVVSMALWFRNKLIVIMNTMLFVLLLIVYLGSTESVHEVNYSFALVALLTARILNWKKNRLEIKTELLRNVYLLSAFVMVPFAFFHSLPVKFVTLSWTLLAIIYFVLSISLTNVKYRYIALGTMVAAMGHLFIVDLARIDIVYRVVAFLFLAIISIFISVYYTHRTKKAHKENDAS
jgi:hypothetical protein